jgi:hypothetical protein
MPSTDAQKLLAIYVQDHYAGSTGGLEMAKHSANANGGTEFGGPLTRVAIRRALTYMSKRVYA